MQNKADSAARVADEIKKTSSASLEPDNEEAEKRIIDAETIAASFQKKADEKYDEAHTIADANTVETDVVPEMDASDSNRIDQPENSGCHFSSVALASFRLLGCLFDLNER